MLEPGRRRLFLDTLRPPDGYLLSRAVGTTFTLDLMALLSVPLAFTFRDAQDGEGQLVTEPLSLLESARRYAGRIVVFNQGGYTGVPRAVQPALGFHRRVGGLRLSARSDGARGHFPSQGMGAALRAT